VQGCFLQGLPSIFSAVGVPLGLSLSRVSSTRLISDDFVGGFGGVTGFAVFGSGAMWRAEEFWLGVGEGEELFGAVTGGGLE
jgi:hypothetical protein